MAKFSNKALTKANRCIRLFLFALALLSGFQVMGQRNSSSDLKKAYGYFLNFQIDSCAKSLTQIPSDPLAFYQEILIATATLIIDDDLTKYELSKNHESELIEKLQQKEFNDAYTIFLKSEIKVQWALVKLKNGDEFSAFWNLKQAYTLAKNNVDTHPEFLPSYKTLGFLHILFGVSPEKYNWILSILGIDGNVVLGFSELDKVCKSTNFFSLECGLTQALAYAYLLNVPQKGVEILSKIHENNNHLLIDYAFALMLMKNAQSQRALEIIDIAELKYPQPFAIPQLFYLKGEIYLQKGQIDEAIKYYNLFIINFPGQNLIKDAYYKIGICYYLTDMPDRAEQYFENSKQKGWAKNETDKNAQNAVAQEGVSSKELYRLRYATDGGFYENALKIEEKIDAELLSEHDKCELYYRKARLLHKSGNVKKAVEEYEKTINFQEATNWYYAPNAALHLGLHYIEENKNEEAVKYLNLIDDYTGYPYQTSIRQQANTALKNLE